MSTPVSRFSVTTPGSTTPVLVDAQTFGVENNGAIVFCSQSSQTVAAFAPGAWTQVTPVVAS